jgi:hypothetical protein
MVDGIQGDEDEKYALELTKLKAMRTKNICISIIYGSRSGYHQKNYLFFAKSVPREGEFFHEMGTSGDILVHIRTENRKRTGAA